MSSINEIKLRKRISRRNNSIYIRVKILLQFLTIFAIGFILGCIIEHLGIISPASNGEKIIDLHISSIFVNCDTLSDYFMVALLASKSDIRHLLFIFISGFTYFCFLASGAMVFFRGFLFGFSALYVIKHLNDLGAIFIIIFIISSFIINYILLRLSISAYVFSFDFRAIKKNRSILRRAPTTYRFSISVIWAIGGILIMNFLYCIIVFLI